MMEIFSLNCTLLKYMNSSFMLEQWSSLPCLSYLGHFLQVEDFCIISVMLFCKFTERLHSWVVVPFCQ